MAQGDHSSIGLLGSLRRLTRNVQVVLSLLAVGIGLTAGLAATDDLDAALRAHGANGEGNLPVVDNRENLRLIGVAREPEVALAYHRALDQARAEEHGEV